MAMRHIWNAPTVDKWHKLPEHDRELIREQARSLKETAIWEFLMEEMKRSAIDSHFVKGTNEKEYLFSKASLWVVDVLDKKLDKLSKLK